MEKYSKWRDAGTGIQPFLPPIAVSGSPFQQITYSCAAYTVATAKLAALAIVALAYALLVGLPGALLGWQSSANHLILRWPSSVLLRLALGIMGYLNIAAEVVSTKRGRMKNNPTIAPRQGDLIVCNWTSYIEVIYLAFRFNPVFALPIHAPPTVDATKTTGTTGRQTGTGSSNVDLPSVSSVPSSPLLGYLPVSMFQMIKLTGFTPSYYYSTFERTAGGKLFSLEELCAQAGAPVVLFPEGSTTNGRGLLRLSSVLFGESGWEVPVRKRNVWVCWFKHSPPTPYTPSVSYSIPALSSPINPLGHLFSSVLATVATRELVVRWLHPDCSPSSGDFLPSEILGLNSGGSSSATQKVFATMGGKGNETLSQCLAVLLLQIGRAKQIGMGWEDKEAFLQFWLEKNKRGTGRKMEAARIKKRR